MPRKAVLLKSLARGRIRASFNKYNLFNLYKKNGVDMRSKSLYQQKWAAKQETRAYHGEHITEGRWQTLFNPRIDSVAQLDASLRSGNKTGDDSSATVKETPFLLQTYAGLEKRLDFALFRAMFASSIRQARQFILHGYVHVNGVKIKHPGYPLKAGDLFKVKPDKVLEALGAKKPSFEEALKIDNKQVILWNKYVKAAKETPRSVWKEKIHKLKNLPQGHPKRLEFEDWIRNLDNSLQKQEYKELKECTPEFLFTEILRAIVDANFEPLSTTNLEKIVPRDTQLAKELYKCYETISETKQVNEAALKGKEVVQYAHELWSPSQELKEKLPDNVKIHLRAIKKTVSELAKRYSESIRKYYQTQGIGSSDVPMDPSWSKNLKFHPKLELEALQADENLAKSAINLPWQKNHCYGRLNPSKPYFTPWKPRPFLAPFAILPHHLEVSFKTCHAIYLRDPVARPGHSEVITPFDVPVHQRAYMYYIRRGK